MADDILSVEGDVASMHQSMKSGREQNFQRWLEHSAPNRFMAWEQAANEGSRAGQFLAGLCYGTGLGTQRNQEKAYALTSQAHDQGYAPATAMLADFYEQGGLSTHPDDKKALELMKSSAQAGYFDAQYDLGTRYLQGIGAPHDDKEAVKYFRMAAEQGDARAQYYLGLCCESGWGVQEDLTEANNFHRMAAEQEHADAQYELGIKAAYGPGTRKNNSEAVEWYRKAANGNHAGACFRLGVHYAYGLGVEKNTQEATKYHRKAAELKHEFSTRGILEDGASWFTLVVLGGLLGAVVGFRLKDYFLTAICLLISGAGFAFFQWSRHYHLYWRHQICV